MTLVLATMADVGDLLKNLQGFIGEYVTTGMDSNTFVKEVLGITDAGSMNDLGIAASKPQTMNQNGAASGFEMYFDPAPMEPGPNGANQNTSRIQILNKKRITFNPHLMYMYACLNLLV